MKVISLDRDVPETWTLGPAIEALRKGELVLFPTDSIYAIGVSPWDNRAVSKLYTAKQMDRTKACSVMCESMKEVGALVRGFSDDAFRFCRDHLPGPYTMLLKASRDLPKQATGKRKTIGIRIPDHPVPQALVEGLGTPLLVSSVPGWEQGVPIDPVEIAKKLYVRPAFVLDQGPLEPHPSTVIDFTVEPPELVRAGKGPVDFLD